MWPFNKKKKETTQTEEEGKKGKVFGDPGMFDVEFE